MRLHTSAFVALVFVSLVACSPQQAAPGAAASASPAAAPAGQQPGTGAATASANTETITGTVLETMDAASYTYVKVKSASGEVWAASSQFKVAVGDTVVVPLETPMENFHSQSLNRDFPLIYFSSRIARQGEPAPPAMAVAHAQMGGMHGGGQSGEVTVTEPIAPPPGGSTIAQVWANRKALSGKTVTVRGKVVRFNPQIMGRNWLHIQDGSGKAADGTHDLAVTTDAMVKKGDIVTVTGTVGIDKDFTAGYTYAVIVEGATVK